MFKMPSKNSDKKPKKENILRVLLGIFFLIAIAFFVIHFHSSLTEKKIQSQEKYSDWLAENCNCLAKERIYCMEGFELSEQGKFCEGDGSISNILKGCSQYDCDGEIVNWSNETKLWSPVLDFGD